MTRSTIGFIFIAILIGTGLWYSCSTSITSPSEIIFPDSNVSYRNHVQPLFNLTCATAGCHDNSSRAGALALTSYNELMSATGVVIPKNPESSKLIQVFDGRKYHPQAGINQVNGNQIQGLKKWIMEGANNN